MTLKTVLVAGATGLVGYAALKHFSAVPDTQVVALSRRAPPGFVGRHLALDLTDATACQKAAKTLREVTHLVYAALFELPGLVEGWRDDRQIETNDRMLRNLLGPLLRAAPGLRHVTLLQGTKAYGVHVRPLAVPAREGRSEMREQPNFYWAQEDYLRSVQAGRDWHFSILRPVLVVGEAIGGAMNLIPALGAHAAVMRERGPDPALSRRRRTGRPGGRCRPAGARHRLGRGGACRAQRNLQRDQWRRLHLAQHLACHRRGDGHAGRAG